MTIFDDPNREAVGLDPIWTDAENPPLPDPASKKGRKGKDVETESEDS